MVRQEKIMLMAQAAAYEKTHYQQDSFAKRYFRQDYIDKERLRARIWATIYFLVYWGVRAVQMFYINQMNFLSFDYVGFVIRILVEYVILLFVVSFIAGFIHAWRYDKAKKRIDEYFDLLDQIDSFDTFEKAEKAAIKKNTEKSEEE